jgi:hypothetical protein
MCDAGYARVKARHHIMTEAGKLKTLFQNPEARV